MKLFNQLGHRLAPAKIIRYFGDARLIRNSNGQHALIGGSEQDVTAAKEWVSLFAHDVVFTRQRMSSIRL